MTKAKKKHASPKHKSGPWQTAPYSLKSLSWFCPLIPNEKCTSVSADFYRLLLTTFSACEDWVLVQAAALRQQMVKVPFSHTYETIKKKHLIRFIWHDSQLITKTFFFLYHTFSSHLPDHWWMTILPFTNQFLNLQILMTTKPPLINRLRV